MLSKPRRPGLLRPGHNIERYAKKCNGIFDSEPVPGLALCNDTVSSLRPVTTWCRPLYVYAPLTVVGTLANANILLARYWLAMKDSIAV